MRSLLLLLLACNGTPDERDLRIAPADGQSDVGAFQPLVVLGDVGFPAEAPVPQVIEVIDLVEGGFVSGVTVRQGDGLAFVADEPWPPDRSFLWTLAQPLDEVRRPEIELPAAVLGSAVFRTDNRFDVLAATVPATDELCLVASRPVLSADLATLDLASGGEALAVGSVRYLEPSQLTGVELPDGDAGLGGVCLVVTPAIVPGAMLRVQTFAGSALLPVGADDVVTVTDTLRRAP